MKIFALIFTIIPIAILFSNRKKNFIVALSCGFIATIIALPVETLIGQGLMLLNLHTNAFNQAFFAAAIPEEILKFFILTSTKLKIKNPKEILILMMLTGLGFGTLENIFYILRFNETHNDMAVIILMFFRYLKPLMMHLLCGIIAATGILFKSINKAGALSAAILFHGSYDAVLMKELFHISDRISLIILLIGALISAFIIRLVTYDKNNQTSP